MVEFLGGNTTISGTLSGSGAGAVGLYDGAVTAGVGGLTLNFAGDMLQVTSILFFTSSGDVTNLGTLNFAGAAGQAMGVYEGGTLDNFGTIIQSGVGNISLHSNSTPTTLKNEAGAFYLIESDSGIDNTVGGPTALINAGTIRKTQGAGVSDLLINGSINNTGVIEADSGTLFLDASSIAQISGNALTAGTWNALNGATLKFPTNTAVAVNTANVTLGGAGATITGLSGLNSNSGAFSLLDGADFTKVGDFSNSGTLTVGVGSALSVGGNFTQTAAGTFNDEIGGAPQSGLFGQIIVSGIGEFVRQVRRYSVNNFGPSAGQDFSLLTFAALSGGFLSLTGLYPFFSQSIGATSLDLVDNSENAVDLQLQSVTASPSAVAGQSITVDWTVSNPGNQATSGAWQDSVYLSPTPTITSASIRLGSVIHAGGLGGNASYNGSITAAVPGTLPGDYYVQVAADSLYEVPDPNRDNNTLAAPDAVSVSVPTLTLGVPFSDSFTASDQGRYYQITAAAGGSLLLALTDSPAGEDNASTLANAAGQRDHCQADFQSSARAGPDSHPRDADYRGWDLLGPGL